MADGIENSKVSKLVRGKGLCRMINVGQVRVCFLIKDISVGVVLSRVDPQKS